MSKFSLQNNWVSLAFLISLAANFFVFGYLISQEVSDYKRDKIRKTELEFDNQISKLVEPFPRSGRRDFYVTMRSKRDELIPMYRNILAQRAAIMDVIAEEQFDAEKLRAAMQSYNDSYDNIILPSQEEIIRIIGEFSVEERKAIVERFKNPPRRDRRSWGDGDRRRSSDGDRRRSSDNDRDGSDDSNNNDNRDNNNSSNDDNHDHDHDGHDWW